jgi:hypothetical protein
MSNEYNSVHELTEDRALRKNGIISLTLAVLGVTMGVYAFTQSRIRVDPIATISVAPAVPNGGSDAHILSTAEFVAIIKNNTSDALHIGTRISTYATNVDSICKNGSGDLFSKYNIVIARSTTSNVVGTISNDQDICASVHRLQPNEAILVASEKPIEGHSSEPVIMTVSDLR